MKKIAWFLISVMSFLTLSFTVYADFLYEQADGEITIIGAENISENVEIPSKIDGIPVTKIGTRAFMGNNSIKTLKIPNSILEIEEGAFYLCKNLTEVVIEKGEHEIEFSSPIFSGSTNLKKITIPQNIIKLSAAELIECSSGKGGIWNFIYGLKIPTIIYGVRDSYIHNFALENSFMFREISDTEQEEKPEGDYKYTISDEKVTIDRAYVSGDIKIPDSIDGFPVVEIGTGAFSELKNILSVEVPKSVIKIGYSAFSECSAETVVLNEGLVEIDDFAFFRSDVKNIELPNTLTEVGLAAFAECNELISITIPKSVKKFRTELSRTVFEKCQKLTTLIFEEGSEAELNYFLNNCPNLTTVVIPESIKLLGTFDFLTLEAEEFGTKHFFDEAKVPKNLTIYGKKGSLLEENLKADYLPDRPFKQLIKVILNDQNIKFDQPPIIEDGRTLVPLRAIFEALNATVNWDEQTKTITAQKGDIILSLQVGSNILNKNGEQITLDVPAKIYAERTLVPLRAVSECFGANVEWNGKENTVLISNGLN